MSINFQKTASIQPRTKIVRSTAAAAAENEPSKVWPSAPMLVLQHPATQAGVAQTLLAARADPTLAGRDGRALRFF